MPTVLNQNSVLKVTMKNFVMQLKWVANIKKGFYLARNTNSSSKLSFKSFKVVLNGKLSSKMSPKYFALLVTNR